MDDQQMKLSHVATSNEESHMAASEEKIYMESSYKWNTKLNSYIIQLSINAKRKFQIKHHWVAYK